MSELAVEYIINELKECKDDLEWTNDQLCKFESSNQKLKRKIVELEGQLTRIANMLKVNEHKGSMSEDKYIDFRDRIWQSYNRDDYAFLEHIIKEHGHESATD